jgi:hypothetical protein
MSIQLTIAVISGVVALLSILLGAWNARSTAVLGARLQSELEQRREQADKTLRLEQVVSRYRDPLLGAAFDLQSRIYNILILGFSGYLSSGDEGEKSYAVNSTLFLIAQYFGWTEALRRGVQFLDLGEVERSRELVKTRERRRPMEVTEIPTKARLTLPPRPTGSCPDGLMPGGSARMTSRAERRIGVGCRRVGQTGGCAQNPRSGTSS